MAASGSPVAAWAGLVADLARITRPDGDLELVEVRPWVEPAGPATARLFEMARSVGRLYRRRVGPAPQPVAVRRGLGPQAALSRERSVRGDRRQPQDERAAPAG
jgi:hypothetical protein